MVSSDDRGRGGVGRSLRELTILVGYPGLPTAPQAVSVSVWVKQAQVPVIRISDPRIYPQVVSVGDPDLTYPC
jgi:hypothetical protein